MGAPEKAMALRCLEKREIGIQPRRQAAQGGGLFVGASLPGRQCGSGEFGCQFHALLEGSGPAPHPLHGSADGDHGQQRQHDGQIDFSIEAAHAQSWVLAKR